MPKTILLIGNGAREHALAEVITKSARLVTFAKAVNPGIKAVSDTYEIGKLNDFLYINDFAKRTKPDFAVVGPEDPLVGGVADSLEEIGIPVVGPKKAPARLEGSKSFTRELVTKYEIPGNPRFETITTPDQARHFSDLVAGQFVVKADGLKGGKGVKVMGDHLADVAEGLTYVAECLNESGKVVMEEKLIGQEFSIMSFVDGAKVVDMPAVQDHKRAFDGDKGPNTGGMGSYTDANHSLPFLTARDLEDAHEINQRVADAIKIETGQEFHGILYGGFMATKDGVRLIEYNVRFGDPEAMNVLPLLETDFVAVCEAIIHGDLRNLPVTFARKATVCKYLVPTGYPDNPVAFQKIEVGALPAGVRCYYAAVDQRDDGIYTSTSRAVGLVGISDTIEEAEKLAEQATQCVSGPVFHRKDIGTAGLIGERVKMLEKLRNSKF